MSKRLVTVIDNQTIAAAGDFTSAPFEIPEGHSRFALAWVITGDGTAKFETLICEDGSNFFTTFLHNIDSTAPIAEGQTSSSGPESDGKDQVELSLRPCTSLKIKCTETGGLNKIRVTAELLGME